MARITLTKANVRPNTSVGHRASATEGEAVRRLLEQQGFEVRKTANGQMEFSCPFHEGAGHPRSRKSNNFYVNAITGLYTCHSASCGERGNLQTLERFFGIDEDDTWFERVKTRDDLLTSYQEALTPELRKPFYDHGLSDVTIERFRLGWIPSEQRYVIPYLEGRRPKFFRYYSPGGDPKYKYIWETGAETSLFNPSDALGDKHGVVIITEGELKAMLLVQMGYAAVGVPGASQWKQEWQAAFTHARTIYLVYDNDNPDFHIHDAGGKTCANCARRGMDKCVGHNPGQEEAAKRLEQIGWRAKNIVLPLPDPSLRKVDINDYFMRDGNTADDFAELLTGKRLAPFKVRTLGEIIENPPEESEFIVSNGILSRQGRLLVAGAPKVGKMQRTSTPVLTPSGWSTMGELRPGDRVVGPDGKPTTVLQIHPHGVKPIYRVTMSDGSWTDCGLDHLWTIQSATWRGKSKRDGPRWRTVDTETIAAILAGGKTRETYIPMVEPVVFDPVGPLPVDPYALGLLLGDGGLAGGSITFTKPDVELHDALAKAFPDLTFTPHGAPHHGSFYLTTPSGQPNPLIGALTELELRGKRSWEKRVPAIYLLSSVQERIALLQGLLDTDGWVGVNSNGNTSSYFSTSSEGLKDDVVHLVESLGGTVRVQHRPEPRFQGGVGRPSWTLRIRLPGSIHPFRLARKANAWAAGRTEKDTRPIRRIVAVDPVGVDDAVCITVDREDGLYVTERFIVTHNSIAIDNLALSVAAGIPFLKHSGFPGFAVSKPTRVLLLDRELSERSLFDRLNALVEARPGYRAAFENLLIDHDHLIRLDQKGAYDLLMGLIEYNGAEVVIFDTAYKFFGTDVEKASSLAKAFDVLDKVIFETGCSVVMTHHRRKRSDSSGKDEADPDSVAGSFLWTGWPNATILLNYLNRSVEDPFNALCTFAAFRDDAPPEPLALYRDRESVAYRMIQPHSPMEEESRPVEYVKPTSEAVGALMLDLVPQPKSVLLHILAARFGVSEHTITPYFLDVMSSGHFESYGKDALIRLKGVEQLESWEHEHGMPERPLPVFDAAANDEMFG